jgi:hypothetical protein
VANYTINFTSGGSDVNLPGKTSFTVFQASSDSSHTSLTLTGQGLSGYGSIQQENFISLLENFAASVPPANPTIGQLWFSSTDGILYVCVNPAITTNAQLKAGNYWFPASQSALASLGYTPVNKAGDTMTGQLVLHADPTLPLGAATKEYVDNVAAGLNAGIYAVNATTTGNLATSYTPGSADSTGGFGIGAQLTATANGALVVDGYTASVNDNILVKNQTNATQNGIYTVSATGSGTAPFVLTRATTYNNSVGNIIKYGDSVFIQSGSTLANTNWNESAKGSLDSGNEFVIGTDSISFTQISGVRSYTAGTGLSLTGLQFALATPVVASYGGTGTTTPPTTGQVPVGTTGGAYSPTSIASGSGISVVAGSGTLSIANTGVLSVAGTGSGISVNTTSGNVTIANTGVTSLTTSSGLSVNSSATGNVSITNTGILSIGTVGAGLSANTVSGSTTIQNTGVTSLTAGTGISLSGSTGAVTITGSSAGTGWFSVWNTTNGGMANATGVVNFTASNGTVGCSYGSGTVTVTASGNEVWALSASVTWQKNEDGATSSNTTAIQHNGTTVSNSVCAVDPNVVAGIPAVAFAIVSIAAGTHTFRVYCTANSNTTLDGAGSFTGHRIS